MKRNERYHPVRLTAIIGRVTFILAALVFARENVFSQTLIGTAPTITIVDPNSAIVQPTPVVNTATQLRYARSRFRVRKVTVNATFTRKHYTLMVLATNIPAGRGVAQPAVNLMTISAATDFIRDIPTGTGNVTCTLQYTASAVYADGNSTQNGGNTVVRVTYTQTTQ